MGSTESRKAKSCQARRRSDGSLFECTVPYHLRRTPREVANQEEKVLDPWNHITAFVLSSSSSSPLSAGGVALPPRLRKKKKAGAAAVTRVATVRHAHAAHLHMPAVRTPPRWLRACSRRPSSRTPQPYPPRSPRAMDTHRSVHVATRRRAFRCLPPGSVHCCLPPHVGLGPPTWRTRKPRAQQSTHRRVLLGRTEYSERRHNNL